MLNRLEKENFVSELRHEVGAASLLVIAHQQGLTVAESTDLRNKVREAGASYKVVKNSLAKLAFEGTSFAGAMDHMKGPTAIAYSQDSIAAAKALSKFADTNNKLILVAAVLNQQVLNAGQVKALASLPSLDELRATLLAVISAPAQKLATVIGQPATSVARAINAYSKKS